ncbi:MAG TPA: DUF1805 domain-containing protein [Candidatus Bathyarchaeota archaeon]|nr:DUF1805 domain-containing protein [Candidatus Bathyarchaeota archaeon]
MICIEKVKVNEKSVLGLKVELPNSPPLLLMVGEKGFVMCGYLNMEVAEKLQVAAAMVSGVKSFQDVLEAEIKAATSKAKELGISIGMKSQEALQKII